MSIRSQKSSQCLSRSEFVSVSLCMSRSHLSWCSWVKERILLFLDGKLPATERSGYKSTPLSSLLKKHVPALWSYVGRWNFLLSPLFCFFLSIQIRILHRYDQLTKLSSFQVHTLLEIASSASKRLLFVRECDLCLLLCIVLQIAMIFFLLHTERIITDSLVTKNVKPSWFT